MIAQKGGLIFGGSLMPWLVLVGLPAYVPKTPEAMLDIQSCTVGI